MPLLRDVRSLFRRKSRSTDVNIGDAHARSLARMAEPGNGTDLRTIEPKTSEQSLRDPQAVVELLDRLGEHLRDQTEHSGRIIELLDRLPDALDALPDISRQNAGMLEVLHEQSAQSKRSAETLNTTLNKVGQATGQQAEVLGLIQQQLDTSSQRTTQMVETLTDMRQGLGDLAESNTRFAETLTKISQTSAKRESDLRTALGQTQRWLIIIAACCAAASLTAILVTVFAK